ncbi:CTD kinase subunit gamma CTK3-domain-containing protein, partial [Protomyces lactucae-debilis]
GRMQFLDLLKRLQASQASQLKTAQFALRHKSFDEDLFSCILEELEMATTSFNVKINILFFLETLCEVAKRSGHEAYIHMVQRDLTQVIQAVAPSGLQGTANVAQTRVFLRKMKEKKFIDEEVYTQHEEKLQAREEAGQVPSSESAATEDIKISREDILRRIEEDRERHKRLREFLWLVPAGDPQLEFSDAWEATSDLNDDDQATMRDELALCASSQS